jgi:hypothetical protein
MERSIMCADDLMASYCHTYLAVKLEGCDAFDPIYIESASDRSSGPVLIGVNMRTESGVEFKPFHSGAEVQWDYPELGMVNLTDFAVYHRRNAQRQWKRGVREHQITSAIVGNHMRRRRGRSSFSFTSRNHILALFNPTFEPLEACIQHVLAGRGYSQAFDRDWAIMAYPEIKHPTVVYKESVVGVVKEGECVLHERASHLESTLATILGGA